VGCTGLETDKLAIAIHSNAPILENKKIEGRYRYVMRIGNGRELYCDMTVSNNLRFYRGRWDVKWESRGEGGERWPFIRKCRLSFKVDPQKGRKNSEMARKVGKGEGIKDLSVSASSLATHVAAGQREFHLRDSFHPPCQVGGRIG